MKITVLDDYQEVALGCADWSAVAARSEIVACHHHVSDPDELQAVLADSEVVVLIRERTPMPAALLDALPRLRLIVTTGAPNTILTPHLGYVTRGLYGRFYREVVEDILAYLDGAPIRVVDP